LIAVAFVGVPAAVTLYVDWLWYGEVGYRAAFLGRIGAKALLGTGVAAFVFALLWSNVRLALRSLLGYELTVPSAEGVRTVVVEPRLVRRLGYLVAAAAALLLGAVASLRWETFVLYRHATPFGQPDAILGRDVGFYVFELPFLQLLQGLLKTALLVALAITVVGHAVAGRLRLGAAGAGPFVERGALRHLALELKRLFLLHGIAAPAQHDPDQQQGADGQPDERARQSDANAMAHESTARRASGSWAVPREEPGCRAP